MVAVCVLLDLSIVVLLASVVGAFEGTAALNGAETYDVVIANGRVMDPESGLDAVRNVGIRGGKIATISAGLLQGKQTIDAKGLIVAPGFIDLHEHGQEPRNYEFQAHDGVTTSLELEAGTADVDQWYAWVRSQGVAILHELKTHRDGARSFYFSDPDGLAIQLIYHPPIAIRL